MAAVVSTGARDETSSQVGASHAMRVCASLATRNYSLFGVSRNLNQIGAELTVTSNREETVYLLESTRNNLLVTGSVFFLRYQGDLIFVDIFN